MFDMMKKLKEAQAKMEEIKARLETITVVGESQNGLVKVSISGNRVVKNIDINNELLNDKDALEDFILQATNRAIESANSINEAEMGKAAQGIMPNIPGLFK